jgi:hypothetical protein
METHARKKYLASDSHPQICAKFPHIKLTMAKEKKKTFL